MMKLLAVFIALIGSLKADQQVFIKDALQSLPLYTYGTLRSSDSVTYALNAVTKGVRSSAIDTAGYVGLSVKLTITAGSGDPVVVIETSNTPTAASFRQYGYIKGQGSGFIPTGSVDRYFRFMNNSSLTQTAVSLSWLPVVPDTSNGQSTTVAGTVTANQGTAGSQNWFAVVTSPATASAVSTVAYVVSGPTVVNISAVAGVAAPAYAFSLATTGTSSVGVLYSETNSATWPLNNTFFTQYVNDRPYESKRVVPAGAHLLLSPTSLTDITPTAIVKVSTVQVR